MNAIRITRRLDSHVIDLPELAPMVGKRVEIVVLEEPDAEQPTAGPQGGTAKGEVLWMAPDFDDTPEGFEEYR